MNPFLNFLVEWSDGNPGAAVFLMGLFQEENLPLSLSIMAKLERCHIRGTDLYILFSDLCNKDYIKVSKLCKTCPDNILKDACSRQDYSGIELVKEYL
jgi:hypothetical protein